ncbi:MAG: transposase [Myxococcales bacterium]|nr:transposase [Myxococcales bacterium]
MKRKLDGELLDGVYVHADGDPRAPLEFRELDAPTHADVAQVAARTAARIESILKAHGRSLDPELGEQELPELCFDEPGLAACYAAAAQGIGVSGDRAGKPLLRLVVPAELPERSRAADATDAPIAEVRGINLHAAQVIDGRDRRRVERLVKYITRPPIAQDRLERRQDGRLELIFKKVWRDGTRALVLEPHDLIARLVAAVPPPRFHMPGISGCSRATHRAGPSSCPIRPWMRPVTSHLRLEAISSSCSARRTMRRLGGGGGRGC